MAPGSHEGHEPRAAEPPRAASHEGAQHSREAQGGHRAQEASPRLVYDKPEEATGGSGVIWRWTVVNGGSRSADDVVATQKITSGHKVLGQSKPCASEHETIVCRYETMGAGDKRTGWLKTSGNLKGGPLRLDARMTWRERPGEEAASHAGAETEGRHPGH
ncbi:hypothetical protein [Actinoallomurus sp. CA-150999]|uniref:hypothetical protein n=1 Tax=Actinoallomurus sp. CA-150999 TaxID=3239887 RepID=UPI003D92BA53